MALTKISLLRQTFATETGAYTINLDLTCNGANVFGSTNTFNGATTFNADVTLSDDVLLKVGTFTTDPSSGLVDGLIWYNATDKTFKVRRDGITEEIVTGATGAGFRAGKTKYNGNGTDKVFEVGNVKPLVGATKGERNNAVSVYLNGILLNEGSGNDYEYDEDDYGVSTVTFSVAPETGDLVLISYLETV